MQIAQWAARAEQASDGASRALHLMFSGHARFTWRSATERTLPLAFNDG
jgi:hypothetical protein